MKPWTLDLAQKIEVPFIQLTRTNERKVDHVYNILKFCSINNQASIYGGNAQNLFSLVTQYKRFQKVDLHEL